MPELLYFCELLTNIQQVSVSIDFVPQDASTQPHAVHIHPSGRALTIASGTENSPILLPIPVDYVSRNLEPSKSYRLPASRAFIGSQAFQSLSESSPVPWDASALTGEISLHCTTCTTQIVPASKISQWKNLPSEHWADLMDLWHCHKPHDEDTHTEGGRYSGVGRIIAQKGIGLVDQLYFLLHKDDCHNTSEIETDTNEAKTVICGSCKSPIGIVDTKAEGIRIMKWSLSLGRASSEGHLSSETFESYSVFKWISSQFLSLIDNSGQRKYLVKVGASVLSQEETSLRKKADEFVEGLYIWIFNPSTLVTTSRHAKPTKALKIYYQELASASQIDSLGDIEIVYLHSRIYAFLKRQLEEENASLPRDLRNWAGVWKTSWLERF